MSTTEHRAETIPLCNRLSYRSASMNGKFWEFAKREKRLKLNTLNEINTSPLLIFIVILCEILSIYLCVELV